MKPDNIFRTGETYKVGDFGSFFQKRISSNTESCAGDRHYMSPQLRESWIAATQYNAFKADVFALGASLLHIVTLKLPDLLLTVERLDEVVSTEVERLPYSRQLKQLMKRMLAYDENQRADMKEVCSVLEESKFPIVSSAHFPLPDIPRSKLAAVFSNRVEIFYLDSQKTSRHTIPINFSSGVSYIELDRNSLLCLGGNPASQEVYSLDLTFFHLTSLPPLCSPREGAGLAQSATYTFVFGGYPFLSSCESISWLTDNGKVSKACTTIDATSRPAPSILSSTWFLPTLRV